MKDNEKLGRIVTKLILRGRKLNISLVFISRYFLKVPKTVRQNTAHSFIMKIPNKREFQKIAWNDSSDKLIKIILENHNHVC